jgi:putative inorganic carbon (hco3(-)) transporter
MANGYYIYLLFITSWFLHLGTRIPALGMIRFDLILVLVLFVTIFFGNKDKEVISSIRSSSTDKLLKILLIYMVVTLPFVEWPGSVLRFGIASLVKAVVFYYFTIYFVTTEPRLKTFMTVFLACQSIRIIEPVYLHLTQGYWGSHATMQGWEFMNRLSGSPSDIVNPNGLAFICLTVIPFYYFISRVSIMNRIIACAVIPLSVYALLLTGSRSGMVGLLFISAVIFLKSKKKIVLILLFILGIALSINLMDADFKDRYESIISSDTKNAATAEGRLEGVMKDFEVALRKPLFGHGIGNSREANVNFDNRDQPSHNLYTEVAQELGFVGLALFIMIIISIVGNFRKSRKILIDKKINNVYLNSMNDAMLVWLYMNIMFSFASYGLTSYEWYLFAGLSVVLKLIIEAVIKRTEAVTCLTTK